MNNKLDKLFKDKLESDSLQPSAQAWEKVEAHLGKKNKMVVWLRVAAALLLFGVLTFVGLNWKEEPKREIVKKETEVRSKEIEEPVIKNEAPKKVVVKKKKKVVEPVVIPVVPIIIEEQQEQPVAIVEEPKHEIKKEKGITLTYSLPSIKKDEPVTVVAKEEPKKTGVQRVLEIAREVKNGDSPLAELREAKDDIFAFDFKKDKNKKH